MNQYQERDAEALDKQGSYYCRHVNAMTTEGLHAKSDIAAELAWRDSVITEQAVRLKAIEGALDTREKLRYRAQEYLGKAVSLLEDLHNNDAISDEWSDDVRAYLNDERGEDIW